MQGKEKDKVLDKVLKNNDVHDLQKQLKYDGHSETGIKAYTIPVKIEDGSIINVQVGEVLFKSKDGKKDQNILFANNPDINTPIVTLGSTEDCLHYVALLAVCFECCLCRVYKYRSSNSLVGLCWMHSCMPWSEAGIYVENATVIINR